VRLPGLFVSAVYPCNSLIERHREVLMSATEEGKGAGGVDIPLRAYFPGE